MRPILLRFSVAFLAFFSFFEPDAEACGVQFVGACGTFFDLISNGQTKTYTLGNCAWMTKYDATNFGTVTELSITKLQAQTWESCDNRVRNAQFLYRIYPQGGAAGAFQTMNLTVLAESQTGAYHNRTYNEYPSLDLLAGLTGGTTYVLEVFMRSDFDANNDGTVDGQLLQNNAGQNFKATFKKSGAAGGLSISFPTKSNPLCAGQSNGALTAAASGGTAPYTFKWSNGPMTAAISGLSAGTFTVTATAANGTTGTASATLVAPATLLAGAAATDETSATANNGSVSSNPSGGTSPYTFLWSTGATAATVSNLDVGTFSVTVTDSKTCTASQSVTVATSGQNPTNYCAASGLAPWTEWISNVKIGTLDNPSSKWTYTDFTHLAPPALNIGDAYPLTLRTDGGWFSEAIFFTAWIDFDRNGSFSAAEKVLSKNIVPPISGLTSLLAEQAVTVPATSQEGITRMRVAIKRGAEAGPCEQFSYGEVEDYNVRLVAPVGSCNLTPTVTAVNCQNNNTPSDPSDDKYTFSIAVAQVGATGSGWTATVNGTAFSAAWGTARTIGPINISAGNASFSVKDNASTCSKNVFVTAPATCSNTVSCSLFAAVTSVDCQNNGTPATGADDKFTFTLNVNGTGISASGWTATINGQAVSGLYNQPKIIGPFDISAGVLSFSVRDAGTASCTYPIVVAPPQPCSITGGPTNYCASAGVFPWEKWISKVTVGDINKTSSKWTYSDFTGTATNLVRGQAHPITVAGSFSWNVEPMHVRVWVDVNRDGVFTDGSETFFSGILQGVALGSQDAPLTGTLTLPATAAAGPTRMRVSMKQGSAPGPCEQIPIGEVEDYTINILTAATAGASDRSAAVIAGRAKTQAVEIEIGLETTAPTRHLRLEKSADGSAWSVVKDWGDVFLPENEAIEDRIMDETPFDGLNFYRLVVGLEDGSAVVSAVEKVIFHAVAEFSIFPNPASETAFLDLRAFEGEEVFVQIIHPTAKILLEKKAIASAQNPLELELSSLPDGEFFVFIRAEGRRSVAKKLIVER